MKAPVQIFRSTSAVRITAIPPACFAESFSPEYGNTDERHKDDRSHAEDGINKIARKDRQRSQQQIRSIVIGHPEHKAGRKLPQQHLLPCFPLFSRHQTKTEKARSGKDKEIIQPVVAPAPEMLKDPRAGITAADRKQREEQDQGFCAGTFLLFRLDQEEGADDQMMPRYCSMPGRSRKKTMLSVSGTRSPSLEKVAVRIAPLTAAQVCIIYRPIIKSKSRHNTEHDRKPFLG